MIRLDAESVQEFFDENKADWEYRHEGCVYPLPWTHPLTDADLDALYEEVESTKHMRGGV